MLEQIRSNPVDNEPILDEAKVFTSLLEAPLDDPGPEDGDNSLLQNHLGGLPIPSEFESEEAYGDTIVAKQATVKAQTRSLVVPLPRTLKKGMKGKDVLALKRAASRAGLRKWGWNFTTLFGRGLVSDIKQFQSKHGLKADGVYGPVTHSKMARYFDSYGAYLMMQVAKALAETPRKKILAYATYGYNKRYYIHYTQSALRMYGVRNRVRPPGIPRYEDCSSFATWCYWGAGVRDPNGLGYNGQGFTGTLAAHGWRVGTPRVGDLAFYGSYPHGHVVVCIGNGRCISHGSDAGPLLLSVNYRPIYYYRRYFS